jgi:DNA (cytosine-5)-methyltransferase 1
LNAFDNTGDSRATVVIVFQPETMVRLGGGIWEGVVPTLRAESHRGDNEPHILILDGTRVDDVRVYDDEITPCLKNRMGTGGNNVPFVAYSIREDAKANNFSATEIQTARALQALQPSVQSHHAQTFIAGDMQVRRLTPTECERLMGWPDDHTLHRADGKTNSDTTRYKMCGNGVASPVAQWIAEQINKIESDV